MTSSGSAWRWLMGSSVLLVLGCPAPEGGDTVGEPTTSAAATTTGQDSSASLSASETSVGPTSGSATETTTNATTTGADSSTGLASCDPETCASLTIEQCEACPFEDCQPLPGRRWSDGLGEWCIGEHVVLGCQRGGICFDYSPTVCDREGTMFYLDNVCPELDLEPLGLELCPPPSRTVMDCEAAQ